MKVAILGAGCYRTHSASGITNFTRACEVAEQTGKKEIAMTHSTIEMGAELLHLAGVDEVVVADPVFKEGLTIVDDFDFDEVIAAHKAGKPEDVMPAIREKVNSLAETVAKPPKGAIHFVDPEDLGMKTTADDSEAVADADWVMTWLPEGGMQPDIIKNFAGDIKEGAIVTHACTIPTTQFKKIFDDLGAKVNVASYHPGAVPEMKGQAYIAKGYASDEAINTLLELGTKARGEAFTLPANLLGPVCDMCSAVTAITYAGILAYRDTVTQILGAPAGFAQNMADQALTQVTALMNDEGIDKMDEALDPAALLGTADSMNFGALAEIVPTVLDYLGKDKKE
ncbi:MAG: 5,10-methenyltetrahydromethanopterin hydrogenase [Methanobrevibacter boviskoreani]|jgi:5,10-methenyltetrahydromethanopterin hydrogenase|uniref:5,10-methenyltetrahydromethanopterin hydrogenase n=1 Tax=Methanobrevibacter boviskoreani TaxID=1348249 RepID=UPI0023A84FE2|nr:5,10-methenyltetrahydromethanopterin hydrogenase [Methanobrevibacter boviskoreani]MCI6775352.1 5,10-methenyltetrahydromethanopterin hydrogenase [Methanobrevibacter boviskoreani]MCI6929642.1 5,10-methenyltetrahydromethanopterin hydrogenase [Methanobrevibacter boviskoreani]MDD6257237.1 5,10-methenyltetrahydromethanopterin hydrogenase [Methanobrevibacter boviskoreani]MDY5614397.1 5,10-methenyltetrahydromethanopterin hydrogenase [Methanobrevibacter boviskoreani]